MSSAQANQTVIKHLPLTVEKMIEKSRDPLGDLTTIFKNSVIISVGMETERFARYIHALLKRHSIKIIARDGRRYYAAN